MDNEINQQIMDNEINQQEFKSCKSFSGYEVSRDGRVRVRATKLLLKVQEFPNKVKYVCLKIGKTDKAMKKKAKYRKIKVSEMIARTYLEKKDRKDILRCKNGNWNDYSLDNYEWYNPRTLPENMTKKWKRAKEASAYDVSEDGDIRVHKTCNPITPYNHKGKPYVTLTTNKTSKTWSVAKLIATVFIANPKNKSIVGHRDGDAWNNKVDNLVWGKRDNSVEFKARNNCKTIDEYDTNGNFLRTWDSISSAAREYKISPKSIRSICKGKYKTAGQRVWRYKGDPYNKYSVPAPIELMPGEYFVPVPNSYAEVSNLGRVVSTYNGRKLCHITKDGSVKITINGKITTKRVYILVAETIIKRPEGCSKIVLKDGNPNNAHAGNIMWVESEEDKAKKKKDSIK